ncbi:MAG TPA: hypothetical protein VIM11_23495 [Tepidisphaeraceae bacterium]
METINGPVVGHIQTDAFCEDCGYNLNTQAVTKDDRLGILICRCPECGRFSAAGKSTSARQPWLTRFGIALLIVWIGFLIWVFGMLALFQGMVAYGHAFSAVQYPTVAPTTRGGFQPGAWHYVIREPAENDDEARRRTIQDIMTTVGSLLLGIIAGGVVSVCMWHTRGLRRLVAFVPMIVGVGFAMLGWMSDPMARYVRHVGNARFGWSVAFICAGTIAGLWLGRPFARAALVIIVPPKTRQHLAFLWTTDGKQLKL